MGGFGLFTRTSRQSYGVGLWKEINKEAMQLIQDCLFEIGERSRVRFWEDVWCRAIVCGFPLPLGLG